MNTREQAVLVDPAAAIRVQYAIATGLRPQEIDDELVEWALDKVDPTTGGLIREEAWS